MSQAPELLTRAKNGETSFFIQLGGQGSPWLTELGRAYAHSELKPFFQIIFSVLAEEYSRVKGNPYFSKGFEIESWLADHESAPEESYLESVVVSMPMIHVTQLAHMEVIHHGGFDREEMIAHSMGVTGHSQGLISSTLLALDLRGDDYYRGLELYTRYLFRLGIRSQDAYPYPSPSPDEISRSNNTSEDLPAPMAAVVGGEHGPIEEIVNIFNGDLPESDQVHISLRNTHENRILSGTRKALIDFHEKNNDWLVNHGIRFVFLKSTCPFHCPILASIRDHFSADVADIGFHFKGSDLKVPVFSFSDGRNLQNEENLALSLVDEIATNSLDWSQAIRPSLESNRSVTYLDFGPGKVSQKFTLDALKMAEKDSRVIALASPRDQKKILV